MRHTPGVDGVDGRGAERFQIQGSTGHGAHEVIEAERIVASYVRAMERGVEGIDDLVALFAEDAVYEEPFSGREHRGRAEIRSYLEGPAATAPRAIRLEVTSMRAEPPHVVVEWTCHSPDFRTPSRGRDSYEITDGLIQRLRTELIEPPTFDR